MKSLILILIVSLVVIVPAIGQWVGMSGMDEKTPAITLQDDGPGGTTVQFQVSEYYLNNINADGKSLDRHFTSEDSYIS
jgi:hypothetical protein